VTFPNAGLTSTLPTVATRELEPSFVAQLADAFRDRAMATGGFPPARGPDVRESFEVRQSDDGSWLYVTCTITGSTYETSWDGSERLALSAVTQAADETADLITGTPRYAWMRSGR